jgi:ABC-type uncharacterized transport system substrate-binding protein
MKRREFITLASGAAAAWPLEAQAQQPGQVRRVGVLMGYGETDPEAKALLSAFVQRLSELGWADGRNLRMDIRWAPGSVDLMRAHAKELVDLQPDVVLANSTPVTAALQRATPTIPIVFVIVSDPVGQGFVASLAHPGGNVTGFSQVQTAMTSKWLQLLKELAPGLKRAAMIFNPDTAPYVRSFFLPSFEAAAQSFHMAAVVAPVHSDAEIETVIAGLGRGPRGGLLVMPDNFVEIHRATIIAAAARNHVPAVYQTPLQARNGGLLSYGADFGDLFRRAAGYVDSILRGAKPSELPVQLPTKYVLVINLKTAKALGLTIPPSLLQGADEVIQ